MKKFVLSVAVVCFLAAYAHAVTVNLSVEVSTAQVTAAQHFIDAENARITAENERLAEQDPPGTPIPLIVGPKAYFEDVIVPRILDAWVIKYARVTHDAADVRRRWAASTDAQRQAALDALAPAPTE